MKNNNTPNNIIIKKYSKVGIIAAIVIVIAGLGIWAISSRHTVSIEDALKEVSAEAVSGADMRIAVVRMDSIQSEADALKDLRKQKESYEVKLRDQLTKEQKDLEKEKKEIEKSQDVLSQEALQRRVVDYQSRVTKLQRDLSERAQSVEMAYQKALNEIQTKHLDPIIEGAIAKKNLSLVIDGRFARTGQNIPHLDMTDEIIKALNKRVSNVKMDTPKGF